MTKREKIITTVLEEILDVNSGIEILNQCLELYRYLEMFKDGALFKEIFGEDGMKNVRKNTCGFATEIVHSEVSFLRDELLERLFEKLKDDSLSYLQLFRVLVAYVFIQGKKLNNVNRFPDTSKINFLKYCYKKMSVVDDISDIELKECCEALKLL